MDDPKCRAEAERLQQAVSDACEEEKRVTAKYIASGQLVPGASIQWKPTITEPKAAMREMEEARDRREKAQQALNKFLGKHRGS